MPGCRAEKTGAVLAECGDLYVENNCVYLKTVRGGERVGAIYRRISYEYLDPLTFKPESLIGIPGVMDAYRAGNVALLNAPGNGVVFGRDLTKQQLEEFRATIQREPRRFIAQEVIDFLDLPIMEGGKQVPRKADLRAFVLSSGEDTTVWASGLTRFSRDPDSFVVNSSQGGGFKDTWVLSR